MQTRLHHETILLEIRKASCIKFQQNLYTLFMRHVEEVHLSKWWDNTYKVVQI